MRTQYYGNSFRDHSNGFKRTSRMSHHEVDAEREPSGDDIPVFDRYATGGRGQYERPYRYEDDHVEVRRLKPCSRY